MTIPEDELEQIDEFAAEYGYTRSGFLLHAAKKAMRLGGAAKENAVRNRAESILETRAKLTAPEQRQAARARADAVQKAIEALQQIKSEE